MTFHRVDQLQYHDPSEAPKTGEMIRLYDGNVIKWKRYKPDAIRQGYPAGRWVVGGEYGGFRKNYGSELTIRWRYMSNPDRFPIEGLDEMPK